MRLRIEAAPGPNTSPTIIVTDDDGLFLLNITPMLCGATLEWGPSGAPRAVLAIPAGLVDHAPEKNTSQAQEDTDVS